MSGKPCNGASRGVIKDGCTALHWTVRHWNCTALDCTALGCTAPAVTHYPLPLTTNLGCSTSRFTHHQLGCSTSRYPLFYPLNHWCTKLTTVKLSYNDSTRWAQEYRNRGVIANEKFSWHTWHSLRNPGGEQLLLQTTLLPFM